MILTIHCIIVVIIGSYIFVKQKERNVLYFVFDPSIEHPGGADRLMAMISLYNAAKKNGYRFKFYYNDPFDLYGYLASRIDWNLSWKE